jgi:hypothetical protein
MRKKNLRRGHSFCFRGGFAKPFLHFGFHSSEEGAARDSVSLISDLHLGQIMVGSVIYMAPKTLRSPGFRPSPE